MGAVILNQKPNRDWVMVKLSFARADGGNNNEDDIHNMQDRKQYESDENKAEDSRDN